MADSHPAADQSALKSRINKIFRAAEIKEAAIAVACGISVWITSLIFHPTLTFDTIIYVTGAMVIVFVWILKHKHGVISAVFLLFLWIMTLIFHKLTVGPITIIYVIGAYLITEWIIEELYWRLLGNSIQAEEALSFFRYHDFPTTRRCRHYRIDEYLHTIVEDGNGAPNTRIAAAKMQASIAVRDLIRGSYGRRRRVSLDRALDIYAPRENAPESRG